MGASGSKLSFSGTLKNKTVSTRKSEEKDKSTDIRQASLVYLLDFLFGKTGKSKWKDMLDEMVSGGGTAVQQISYEEEGYIVQEQGASFEASGIVQTEDGRQIDFSMKVNMTSRFEKWYRKQVDFEQTVNLCDPLVINLDGNVTQVSDQTFTFDLDLDGKEETIHKLGSGRGFLALDKNGDGKINDGHELFGTESGDGFADLAAYDEDHNGWIDENDSIFEKLKIWVQDENGNSTLYSLKDKNVGALYLGSQPTYLNSYDKTGSVDAVIRSTGFFLYESGQSGTMQHVDMAY